MGSPSGEVPAPPSSQPFPGYTPGLGGCCEQSMGEPQMPRTCLFSMCGDGVKLPKGGRRPLWASTWCQCRLRFQRGKRNPPTPPRGALARTCLVVPYLSLLSESSQACVSSSGKEDILPGKTASERQAMDIDTQWLCPFGWRRQRATEQPVSLVQLSVNRSLQTGPEDQGITAITSAGSAATMPSFPPWPRCSRA